MVQRNRWRHQTARATQQERRAHQVQQPPAGASAFAKKARASSPATSNRKTTPRLFEPLRAEPNGFRVHLLNRSGTVSLRCNCAVQALRQTGLKAASSFRLRRPCVGLTLRAALAARCGISPGLSAGAAVQGQETLPEWSKGADSSSTSASCVGSNPTDVMATNLRK